MTSLPRPRIGPVRRGRDVRSLAIISIALLLAGCARGPVLVERRMRAQELSLAVTPAGSFVAWHGGFNDGSSIYVQEVADGQLVGSATRISDGKRLAYEPDLIAAGDRMFVAWYEKDLGTRALSVWMAGLDLTGGILWRYRLDDGTHVSRNPVVRLVGDRLHVAWIEQAGADNEASVWHQQFSLAGTAETPPEQIGEANRDTWNLNATVSGKSLIVTYDAALAMRAHELQMLVLSGKDVRRRQLSPDDGQASLYPDLQVNDAGQAALTWFDEKDGNREVYLLLAPLEALVTDTMPKAIRITMDKGESIGAYVAWNGSVVGLAWSDNTTGRHELYTQMFLASGRPVGPPRRISASEGQASVPSIRMSGAGFLVAWNDYITISGNGHERLRSSKVCLRQLSQDRSRTLRMPRAFRDKRGELGFPGHAKDR